MGKPREMLPMAEVMARQGLILEGEWADRLRAARERYKQLAPVISEKYGVTEESAIRELINIEQEQALCEGCRGVPCQKQAGQYWQVKALIEGERVTPQSYACRYKEQMNLQARLKRSGLPKRYADKTFDDYEVTADNERAVKIARWYVSECPGKVVQFYMEKTATFDKGLYLYGNTGTGKTYLATLIAMGFLRKRHEVVFGDVPSLLETLKRTFDTNEDTYGVLRRYIECDLLVLDDIGTGKITDWNAGILYQVINARYADSLPIIATSNYSLAELRQKLSKGDEVTGKRIVSRLSEMCHIADLGKTDRRVR